MVGYWRLTKGYRHFLLPNWSLCRIIPFKNSQNTEILRRWYVCQERGKASERGVHTCLLRPVRGVISRFLRLMKAWASPERCDWKCCNPLILSNLSCY